MNKQIKVFAIIALLLSTLPLVSAAGDLDYFGTNTTYDGLYNNFPNAAYSARYQTFMTDDYDIDIYTVRFAPFKSQYSTGTFGAAIYEHTGTFGVNGLPTDLVAICTGGTYSGQLPVSIMNTFDDSTFKTWSYVSPPTLQANTAYCVVIFSYLEEENEFPIYVVHDESTPTHEGNSGYWDGDEWQADAGADLVFWVSGLPSGVTPTPTPTSAPTATGAPTTFSTYINWIIWGIIIAGFVTLMAVIVYSKNRRDNR